MSTMEQERMARHMEMRQEHQQMREQRRAEHRAMREQEMYMRDQDRERRRAMRGTAMENVLRGNGYVRPRKPAL